MKVSVFTLGCKTNFYESQQIVARLVEAGHDATTEFVPADVFVVNSCAITKEAERKSRQAVARARKLNPDCKVIVVGCASEKNAEQFVGVKGVSYVKGVEGKQRVAEVLEETGVDVEALPSVYRHEVDATQEKSRAFVKIQDGCNNFCSYCIVPYLRGRSRSKKIVDVRREVFAANSAETVLIGIDVSQYGKDSGESLAELFRSLRGAETRIRLGSLEASVVTDEVLDALAELDFCPHFHLSLQSGCDAVLKRMNRHYTTTEFAADVAKIRSRFPTVAVTTDVIVGFCGETEEEFEETCRFVRDIGFADVHVFPYSPREGTVAYKQGDDVPADVKKERVQRLTAIKKKLKKDFCAEQIGRVEEVLVEQCKDGYFEGYTKNYVRAYFVGDVKSGDVVQVLIKETFRDGVKGELI